MRELILSDEQKGFMPWLLNGVRKNRCVCLTGHAGSGKTTMMKMIENEWDKKRIFWCCPSHQAKNILSGKLENSNVYTVASALGLGRKIIKGIEMFVPSYAHKINDAVGKSSGGGKFLLVVDESSMIDSATLKYLIESRVDNILFIGDPAQLPPVSSKHSPVYCDNDFPKYHLSKIFRQESGSNILQVANDTREQGVDTTVDNGIENILLSEEGVSDFFYKNPNGIALAPTHHIKDFCNRVGRMVSNGGVEPTATYMIGERLFLESPVNPPKGPKNGAVVTISTTPVLESFEGFRLWRMAVTDEEGNSHSIMAPFDDDERKIVDKKIYALGRECKMGVTDEREGQINRTVEILKSKIINVSHGFSMTIHKSQGSTFETVLLCVKGLDAFRRQGIHLNMVYTGITRASKKLVIGR